MKILNIVALLWSFGAFTGVGHALDLEDVVLLEKSTSSKSVVIDRGLLENFKEGTIAKFFMQSGDYKFPKIFLVGEGRLVKSFPKKSYWLMSKVELPKLLHAGEHYLLMTKADVLAGRPMKIKQRHVVVSEKQYQSADEYLDKNTQNIPDRLIKDAEAYELSEELYETKKVPEADVQVQTYEVLRNRAGTQFSDNFNDDIGEKFFIGNRKVEIADIKNAEDQKLLDSMAKGLEEKINSQKFGLTQGLYKNQKKIPGSKEMNDQITITSMYDQEKEDKKIRETISPKAQAKMDRDGPAWSEDMDDAALRRYFIRTGLEREERRRELVLNELDGNEIMLHYSGSMSDHSSDVDENYRGLGYMLGVSYDLHLSRTSKNLKNWSLQFAFETGVVDYDIGGQNARGQEGSYGAYLNYYFVHNPLTLNSFIWLAGVGIKAGSVKMQSKELSKEYSYQALTLPALQVMTKYRFRSGDLSEDTVNVGASINAGVMLESKRLSVIDTLDDDINGKISVNDLKYTVGMSVYF